MYLVKSLSCHSDWEFGAPMPLKLELALKASLFVIDVVTQLSGACSDTSTEAEFTDRDEACPIMVMKTNAKRVFSDDNFPSRSV